jgi:hypothetical protein
MSAVQIRHDDHKGHAAVRRICVAMVLGSALVLTTMVASASASPRAASHCRSATAGIAKTNGKAQQRANTLLESTRYTSVTRTFTPKPSSTRRFTGYQTIAVKSPKGTTPVVGYFKLTGTARCSVVVTSARVALSHNAYLVALKFPGEQGKTGSLKVTLISARKASLGGSAPLPPEASLGGSAPLPTNLIVNVATGSAGQQQLTVPQGVTSAVVFMQGGAGDPSEYESDRAGAAITGTLSVTPGEVLTVGAATKANGASGGWGPAAMSGGTGAGSGDSSFRVAGGGGGASAILDGQTPLMVAGGGGGNGGAGGILQCTQGAFNGFGGSGGAPGSANLNGTACTQLGDTASGGVSGAMPTGTGGVGGLMQTNIEGGGGGGGGYLGGVGGGGGPGAGAFGNGGGGGGAGSSYVDPARVSAFAITSQTAPGNGALQIYWIGSTGWVPANGQTQTITAPAGASQVSFMAVGGGGGSTGGIDNAGHGGNGAQVVGGLAVTPGQTFQITAGTRGLGSTAGGGNGSPGGVGPNGYTGGAGGSGGSSATGGGGGGAATVVQTSGSTLFVAGGGGGAGAGSDNNGGAIQHGNGGGAGATADNGSKGFGTQGGGAGKGGYGPTGVGQTAQNASYNFVGGGGGGGVLGGSAGTPGGGDGFGTGGGGGAGSSMASSALTNASITTAPSAEDGFVIITWTIS